MAKKNVMPSKQHVNLFYKHDRTTKIATYFLYFLLLLALCILFGKYMVFDLIEEKKAAQADYEKVEAEMNAKMAQLTDFAELKLKYQRYSQTDEEKSKTDRVEIIAALDKAIGSMSKMRSFTITGEQAQIRFDSIPLSRVSDIVAALEKEPLVKSITLNTAGTQNSEGKGDGLAGTQNDVSANILIELKLPSELEAESEAAAKAETKGGTE